MRLRDENFLIFAMHNYDNPSCESVDEFQEDLKHFKYLKRLFNRYAETGELKERLILNHITVIYNLFGPQASKMLFFKMRGSEGFLKPFLVIMGKMPLSVEIGGMMIPNEKIPADPEITKVLELI